MPLSRHAPDGRRADELDQKVRLVEKRELAPALKQMKDGQMIFVRETGEMYYRDRKKVWKYTGTEVP